MKGGFVNKKQILGIQDDLNLFEHIKQRILNANKDIYNQPTKSFNTRPVIDTLKSKAIYLRIKEKLKEDIHYYESKKISIGKHCEEYVVLKDKIMFIYNNIKNKHGEKKIELYQKEIPDWQSYINILKKSEIQKLQNDMINIRTHEKQIKTIINYYNQNKKLIEWNKVIKIYNYFYQPYMENDDEKGDHEYEYKLNIKEEDEKNELQSIYDILKDQTTIDETGMDQKIDEYLGTLEAKTIKLNNELIVGVEQYNYDTFVECLKNIEINEYIDGKIKDKFSLIKIINDIICVEFPSKYKDLKIYAAPDKIPDEPYDLEYIKKQVNKIITSTLYDEIIREVVDGAKFLKEDIDRCLINKGVIVIGQRLVSDSVLTGTKQKYCENLIKYHIEEDKEKKDHLESINKLIKETNDKLDEKNIPTLLKSLYRLVNDELFVNPELNNRYNKIYNSIFPLHNSDAKFFSFLKVKVNTEYIVFQYIDNMYYELYSSNITLSVNHPNINLYLLESNFTFKLFDKSRIPTHQFKMKDPNRMLPNIDTTHTNLLNVINAQVLMSNPDVLKNVFIFYDRFIGDNFKKWINNFVYIIKIENGDLVLYNKISNIIKICTLASCNKLYFDIYNNIDNMEEQLQDYEYIHGTSLYTKDSMKINSIILTERGKGNINIIRILKEFIKNSSDEYILDISYILNILEKADGYENKKLVLDIFKIIEINMRKLSVDNINRIISCYNFYKINDIYNDFKKYYRDFDRSISNTKQINKLINMNKHQILSLFIIDFFEELYNYYILRQSSPLSSHIFYKDFIHFIYFQDLKEDPIISKLTNIDYQYSYYTTKDIKSLSIVNCKDEQYVRSQHINIKFFYKNIFQIVDFMEGYMILNYTEADKYCKFTDPRKDYKANNLTNTGRGRPYCGEVCFINFINLLLYNSSTRKLDHTYLPDNTPANIIEFFRVNNKIEDFKGNVIQDFYNLLANIKFTLRDDEIKGPPQPYGTFSRDYGDLDTRCVYRYFTTTPEQEFTAGYKSNKAGELFINLYNELPKYDEDENYTINEGRELRLSYFNLCRTLAYLLDMKDIIANINTNLSPDSIKEIIRKFKNPHTQKIIERIIVEIGGSIYDMSPSYVNIFNYSFLLSSHSELKPKNETVSLNSLLPPAIISSLNWDKKGNIIDIPYGIYIAYIKGESILSNLDYNKVSDDDIIKMMDTLKYLHVFQHAFIIKEFIKTKRYKVLEYLSVNNTFHFNKIWEFLIDNDDFEKKKQYIDIYIPLNRNRKLNKILTNISLSGINIDQFYEIQDKINLEYIDITKLYKINKALYDLLIEHGILNEILMNNKKKFIEYILNNEIVDQIEFLRNLPIQTFKGITFNVKEPITVKDYFDMLLRQFIKDKPQILQYMQNSGDNELKIFNFIISILNSNIGIQVHTIIKMFNELTEIINKTINKDDYMYAIFKEKKQLFNIQRILLDKIIDNSGKEIYEKFCSNIMLILGGYLRPIYQNIYKSYYFTVADNFKDFSRRLKVEDKINKIEKRLKEANTILNVLKKRPTLFLNLRKNIVRPLNNLFSELDPTANEHISKYFEIKYKDNIVKSKFDENQFDILIKTLQVSINLGDPVSLSLIGSAVVSVANPHPLPDDALHKYIKYKQKYLLLKKRFENTK